MGGHILSEHLMEKYAMFHVKYCTKLKSFLIQQFFKNVGEVQGE